MARTVMGISPVSDKYNRFRMSLHQLDLEVETAQSGRRTSARGSLEHQGARSRETPALMQTRRTAGPSGGRFQPVADGRIVIDENTKGWFVAPADFAER
jgi:hypothetical protein